MADYISQFTGGEIDRRLAKVSELEAGKQDKLVSGENIKTVGGQSLLGEGDIPLTDQEAVKFTPQTLTDAQKAQALANIGAASEDEVAALADQKYEGPYATIADLPAASASTTGAIYLVGPDGNGEYDRYVTKLNGSTYTWGSLGKTSIDLSNYATKEEVTELELKVDEKADQADLSQLEAKVNKLTEDTEADFAIADDDGYNILELSGGHIKTKNFNSEDVPTNEDIIPIENEEDADLSFSDDEDNVLCEFAGGHIKTKFFDSSKLPINAIKKAVFMGDSITQGVYSYWHNGEHAETDRYNGFDIINMGDVAEATAYHGIHYYFGLFSGAEMVNLGKRGTGWVADTRGLGTAPVVANRYNFAGTDFVALCFGVNDYIQGKAIGDITTKVAGTVIGNMCTTIEKILTDNPLCKVVVYSPYNTWGQVSYGGDYTSNVLYGTESTNYALGHTISGHTLQDIIDAEEAVCDYYGIQCVNLSKSNVVNRFTIKNILVDGLHPTKESYIKLAAEIYGKGNFGA